MNVHVGWPDRVGGEGRGESGRCRSINAAIGRQRGGAEGIRRRAAIEAPATAASDRLEFTNAAASSARTAFAEGDCSRFAGFEPGEFAPAEECALSLIRGAVGNRFCRRRFHRSVRNLRERLERERFDEHHLSVRGERVAHFNAEDVDLDLSFDGGGRHKRRCRIRERTRRRLGRSRSGRRELDLLERTSSARAGPKLGGVSAAVARLALST